VRKKATSEVFKKHSFTPKKSLTSLVVKKNRIMDVKKLVNCILENGAYSNKNEQRQIAKSGDNYDTQEKTIVHLGWKYRKFLGRKMQSEMLDLMKEDEEFLEDLKLQDKLLYDDFKGMIDATNNKSAE